jgi:hypothetical protein
VAIVTEDPFDTVDIEISTLADDNATVASVTLWVEHDVTLYATGSYSRPPHTPSDPAAEAQLAVGRALVQLGLRLVAAGSL